MNKKLILVTTIIVALLILGVTLGFKREARVINPASSTLPTPIILDSTPSPTLSPTPTPTEFEASFEIYTNGTKRIFTDPKYHYQSSEVYLTPENPSIIYLKKIGVTWDDFFKTLPFSVTSDCLVTGTKQTFCSTSTQKLRFIINGVELPNALNMEIKAGDVLKVVYGS